MASLHVSAGQPCQAGGTERGAACVAAKPRRPFQAGFAGPPIGRGAFGATRAPWGFHVYNSEHTDYQQDPGRFNLAPGGHLRMEVKSRHHLRDDAIAEIEDALDEALGVDLQADTYEKVDFEESDWEVVLVDGDPLVIYVDGKPFLTVQGLNAHPPERHVVTVDAGAVSFVSDGADVMRPGITEADEAIADGDLVAINEESHGKFLGVGRAMTDGDDMLGEQGKVVKSIHHVGDDLFEFTA